MGVDTKGIFEKEIKKEDMFNFIRNNYDENMRVWDGSDKFGEYYKIDFEHNDVKTGFSFIPDCESDKNYYKEQGIEIKDKYNYISSYCCEENIKIIKDIVSYFGGGYVDDNDCDDKNYYYVPPREKTDNEKYQEAKNLVVEMLNDLLENVEKYKYDIVELENISQNLSCVIQ